MTLKLRRIALPLVIVLGGLAVSALLAVSRKAPPRKKRTNPGPLVEAMTVHRATVPVVIPGNGTVRPKVSAQLVPQVAGRVVALHPAMTAGGFFQAGEVLIRIDPADYRLAVRRARATVKRAQVQLELARADAAVARREWNRMHPGEEPPSPLVVKQPQVEQAEADLGAAQADLDTAKLNLERTRLSLPFDGRVVSKSVDVGQYVTPGQPVAQVYGTGVVEIPVPLEDADLAWFKVPQRGRSASGSRVEVSARFGGKIHRWRGRVARTEGEIDTATRMVHVVVEVRRPFPSDSDIGALIPGMFVDVAIHGRDLDDAFEVPRSAVHGGLTAWVVRSGRLRLQPVKIARFDGDTALVTSGLKDGEILVTSQMEVVTDGMKVRVYESPQKSEKRPVAGS